MSYTSYFYLLFFLGVLVALYYLMPLKKRWLVLLGGSYFFYWLASGKLIVFLLITTVSVYLGALAMEREQQAFDSVRKSLEKEERKARKAVMMRRKRHIVFAMVLINVGLLAFLKYYHFFSANINALGSHLEPGFQLPALKLLMPLGHFFLYAVSGGLCDRCLPGADSGGSSLRQTGTFPQPFHQYYGRPYQPLRPACRAGL